MDFTYLRRSQPCYVLIDSSHLKDLTEDVIDHTIRSQVSGNTALTHLPISGSVWAILGEGKIPSLLQSLPQSTTCLQALHLWSRGKLGIGLDAVQAVETLLSTYSCLHALYLIGPEQLCSITAQVAYNTSLRDLHMCYEGVTTEGADAVMTMLMTNTRLEKLGLDCSCHDTSAWSRALGQSLALNSSLQHLHFQTSQWKSHEPLQPFGSPGYFAVGSSHNVVLKRLDLQVPLNSEGVPVLAEAMKQNTSLQVL
jgi:hypothetical protein